MAIKTYNTQLYKQYRRKVKPSRYNLLVNFIKSILALVTLIIVGIVIFPNELIKDVQKFYITQVTKLNLNIEEITIEGVEKLSAESLKTNLDISIGSNIMLADIDQVKSKLETLPWIRSAIVERILPKKIQIIIEEEIPQAIYYEKNKYFLINQYGKIIEEIASTKNYPNFILVKGIGSNFKFENLLEQLHSFQSIYKQIEYIDFINGRRWDIKLKNNFLIKLPEDKINDSLKIFEDNFSQILKLYKICVVDLRLIPDKIYLKIIN